MKQKNTYCSPVCETLYLGTKAFLCQSFDGTDNTEIIPVDDELIFVL